ncbi:MAG: hypothetical protein ACYDEE_00590 [Ignavibacteriaceae bacterium]
MKMEHMCKNHPNARAFNICHFCNEYFCESCLVEGDEYYYCYKPECQKALSQEKEAFQTQKIKKITNTMDRWYSFMFGHKKSIEKMMIFGFIIFFISAIIKKYAEGSVPNLSITVFYSVVIAVFGLLVPLFYAILIGGITRIFSKQKAPLVFIWTYRIFYWGLFIAVLINTFIESI